MTFPLQGLRVLDFGQGIAGPYCGQLLGDHGADVIKVEPPRGDWSRTMGTQHDTGLNSAFVSVNRNKRSLSLDLRDEEAIRIALELADKADVLIESFRPGVMDRLGLGCTALRERNPGLVYCSVTGFGESGPNVDFPASDSIMQGYGGLMSINGERGGDPLRMGNVVTDMVSGANAFGGVLLGLLARNASGEGRRVQIALLDSIVAFQASPLTEHLMTGSVPQRLGNDHPLTTPAGVFRTRDGLLSLAVMDHKWGAFCEGLGLAHLEHDPRYLSSGARQANRDALGVVLASVFASRATGDWIALLRGLDILCGPVNDYPALMADPQVTHNALLHWVPGPTQADIPLLRNPVRIEDESPRLDRPPMAGEHTREILARELHYAEARIEALVARKAALCAG